MTTKDQLRHRYLELHAAREPADAALRAALAATELPATAVLRGLPICAWPSARFMELRFVPAAVIDAVLRDHFVARGDPPEFVAVFVNPAELSYHCFEQVLPLDALFEGLPAQPIRLPFFRDRRRPIRRIRTTLAEDLRERLARLDALDLYTAPRGQGRGGRRFLLSAAPLADALAAVLRETMSKTLASTFVGVNPVFRYNRFEPGDARFEVHHDVPFSWSAAKLVSKQSLLLYLTSGRGRNVLRFAGEPGIDELEAGELIIFDQSLAHEGGPYDDGPKLFLRSELIFRDPALVDAPDLAALFAKACYLDGLSPLAPELARVANEHYERVTRARFSGRSSAPAREHYVHAEFAGVHYVTNGYDGWFRARDVDPIEAATLMVLELLNPMIGMIGEIGERAYRKLRRGQTYQHGGDARAWIAARLAEQPEVRERPFTALDEATLLPPPEAVLERMDMPSSLDFDTYPDDWDSHRNESVVDMLRRAQRWALRRLRGGPITLLGKQVFVAPERFVVRGDKIHLVGPEPLGPLHFAGATFLHPADFLEPTITLQAWQTIVPPITFAREGELLHLACDLFRNSWMVDARLVEVPIPQVKDDEVTGEEDDWHQAVTRTHDRAELLRELAEPLEPLEPSEEASE